MDPNNFMLNGGMPQNGMQRPQPGNEHAQIYQRILEELRKITINNVTWQATVDVRERANHIMQMVIGLRQINDDILQCINIAVKFETGALTGQPSKEHYLSQIRVKVQEIATHCQRKAAEMINFQALQQNNFQGMQQPNLQGMQQNNLQGMQRNNLQAMQGMQPGMLPQTPMQQNRSNQGDMSSSFPSQLQHQMQASPLNMPPQAMFMPTESPSMLAQNQQPQQPQQQQQPRDNMPMANNFTPEEHAQVMKVANGMFHALTKEQHTQLRDKLLSGMTPQQREQLQRQGSDVLPRHFYKNAANKFIQQKALHANRQANQMQGMQGQSGNAQLASSQTPSQANALLSSHDIDFSAFAGQQADALKMQESGQLVVPASNNNLNPDKNMGNMPNLPNMGQGNQMTQQMAQQAQQAQLQNIINQRQQQAQREAALRNSQAQAQAHAQAQARSQPQAPPRNGPQGNAQQQLQLKGQPGGLNANQAIQQSPAMSMLNRPMVPPGQQGNATPQQRPQQPTPQMSGQTTMNNNAPALFQPQQLPFQFPANMPPQVRQRLAGLPEEKLRQVVANWQQQNPANLQPLAQVNTQVPLNNMQRGQQGLTNNMGMQNGGLVGAMPQFQPGMAQVPQNGMVQGMNSSMVQGGNPAINHHPLVDGANTQAEIQQRLLQQQMITQKLVREMDTTKVPPRVMEELRIPVPPGVQTWAQLKEYTQQAPNMPPGIHDKLRELQTFVFQRHVETRRGPSNGQQIQVPSSAGPGAPQTQVSAPQAPQAQMVPQQAQAQHPRPTNMPDVNMPQAMQQATPQEIRNFRARFGPKAQNMTDEQIRSTIVSLKLQQAQKENTAHWQQQQQLQQQQQQQHQSIRQMPQHGTQVQQVGQPGQPGQPGQQAQQGQQGQHVQQFPQQGLQPQHPPRQVAPQAPVGQAQMPAPAVVQNGKPLAEPKGQKRPSDEPTGTNRSPQRPNQPTQSVKPGPPGAPAQQVQGQLVPPPGPQNRPVPFTPEQLQGMSQEQKERLMVQVQQRQQTEVRNRTQQLHNQQQQQELGQSKPVPNQQALNMTTAQAKARVQAIIAEIDATTPKGPPVSIDAAGLADAVDKLRVFLPMMGKMELSARAGLQIFGEEVFKRIARIRTIFFQQMDRQGNINEYLSIHPHDIDQMSATMTPYLREVATRFARGQVPGAQSAQQEQPKVERQPPQSQLLNQQAHAPAQAQAQAQQTPTGQQQNEATQQPASRKSTKIPAAPTSAAPPFAIGGHGIPVYDDKPGGLTPDKLQLPLQKKRKTGAAGSAASTPVAQGATPVSTSSPQLTAKLASPEHRRQQQVKMDQQMPQPPREPEKRFKCKDEMCDSSIHAFEKEEELQQHVEAFHQKIENPLQFFLDSAAAYYGVDADGNPLVTPADPAAPNKTRLAVPIAKTPALVLAAAKKEALKMEGQTSGKTKQDILTPTPGLGFPSSPASGHGAKKFGTSPAPGLMRPHVGKLGPMMPTVYSSPGSLSMREILMGNAGVPSPKKADHKSAADAMESDVSDTVKDSMVGDDFMGAFRESPGGIENIWDQYKSLVWGEIDDHGNTIPGPMRPRSPPTPTTINSSTGSLSSSSSSDHSSTVHENDRLKVSLGSSEVADLEAMARENLGMDDDDERRPELTYENIFGEGAGFGDPADWHKNPWGNSVFDEMV